MIVSNEDGIMGVGGIAGRRHNGYLPFSTMLSVSNQPLKRKGGKKYRQQLNCEAAVKRWIKNNERLTCDLEDRSATHDLEDDDGRYIPANILL